MKKLIMFLTIFLGVFSFVTSATGTTYDTSAVLDEKTYMETMEGMKVTATFYDSSNGEYYTDSVIWSDTGAAGSTSTYSWTLTVSGDTYGNPSANEYWTLTNNSNLALVSLYIDGDADNTNTTAGIYDTVFDIVADATGSPESYLGRAFFLLSGSGFSVTYAYADKVTVDSSWYGDLYKTLTLSFGSYTFKDGAYITFMADTDTLQYPLTVVPEPATFLLFGLGFLGLAGVSRKKQK